MICQRCGGEIPDSAEHCPSCGVPIDEAISFEFDLISEETGGSPLETASEAEGGTEQPLQPFDFNGADSAQEGDDENLPLASGLELEDNAGSAVEVFNLQDSPASAGTGEGPVGEQVESYLNTLPASRGALPADRAVPPPDVGGGDEPPTAEDDAIVVKVRGVYGLSDEDMDRIWSVGETFEAAVEPEESAVTLIFGIEGEGLAAAKQAVACTWELASSDSKRPFRVGIYDSTFSVFGNDEEAEYELTGEGESRAEALAASAGPNQILISGRAARRVPIDFQTRPVLPPAHFEEPVFEIGRSAEGFATERDLPFVGREAARAELVGLASEAQSGIVCLVRGPEGVGKSRLIHEVAADVAELGVLWHVVPASAQSTAGPNHPLSAIAALGWSSGGLAGTMEPFVVDLMLDRHGRRTDGVTGERRQVRIIAAALEGLDRRLEHGPVVLVLDDMHRADELTWALAQRLVDVAHLLQGSVVLCVRPEDPLPIELPEGATTIDLEPLSEDETRSMTEAALGGDVDSMTVELVASRAMGIPLVAEEIFRTISRGQGSLLMAVTGLEPKEAVDRLVSDRVEALSEAALNLLCSAAVLGLEPSRTELMEFVEESHETMAALVELESMALLVRGRGQQMRFLIPRVREVALGALPRAAVRELHGRAAEFIGHSAGAEGRRIEIGEHLLEGGKLSEAFAELRIAAKAAREDGETQRAATCFHRCIKTGGRLGAEAARERAAVARDYGEILVEYGRYDEAEELTSTAHEQAKTAGENDIAASLLRLRGQISVAKGEPSQAIRELEEAQGFAELHKLPQAHAEALGDLAEAYEALRQSSDAVDALRRGLDIIEDRSDAVVGETRLRLLKHLGRLETQSGRAANGVFVLAQALTVAEELGNKFEQAEVLSNLAGTHSSAKNFDKALRSAEGALAISSEIGDAMGISRHSFNLALLFLKQNRNDEARDRLWESYEAALRSGWRDGIAMSDAALRRLGEE